MSVFKSREVLDPDYTPSQLPHRERELRELLRYFEPVLEEEYTARVHVYGPKGTGKTVLCRRFGRDFEEEASKRGQRLRYVHVNLSYTPKIQYILAQIMEQVSFISFPVSGLGPEQMLMNIASALMREDYRLVLCLDEVDTYLKEGGAQKIFYMFGRFHEVYQNTGPRLSLIYVSRDLRWINKLEEATLDTLGRVSGVHLEEYGLREIWDILTYRAEEALVKASFSEDIIRFIADLSLSNGGIRYALELLLEAGGMADRDFATLVRPDHVRRAHVNIPKGFNGAYYPSDLSLHKQLLLMAVIDSLDNYSKPYIEADLIYDEYRIKCEKYGREAREAATLPSYLKDLRVEGYILLRDEGTLIGVEFPIERMRESVEEALRYSMGYITFTSPS